MKNTKNIPAACTAALRRRADVAFPAPQAPPPPCSLCSRDAPGVDPPGRRPAHGAGARRGALPAGDTSALLTNLDAEPEPIKGNPETGLRSPGA